MSLDDRQRMDRLAARTIGAAAAIASGYGRYALANTLWAFAAELRSGEPVATDDDRAHG
jgi:hypothetical protein